MKQKILTAIVLLCLHCSFAQVTFNPAIPVMVTDNSQSLQGLKQEYFNLTPAYLWERPGINTGNISMYIGSIALNPNNLSEVFFSDNSATNKLYYYNKATNAEVFTGSTFTGATQGVNTGGSLPVIGTENLFGINMMVINNTNNTGYAISRNKNLYTFGTSSPYTISNLGLITDQPGNAVLYANAVGGGLMVNIDNRLTALVNIPQAGGTFKYYFFDIDPTTLKAKLIYQTDFVYGGFQDNTSFIMGAGITNVNSSSIYCSLYTGVETIVYSYNSPTNLFGDNANGIYVSTNNNAFGDISGIGKTSIKAVVPVLDFIWQGTINTNWNTAGNWNKNAVPTSADPVIIPSGTPFSPTLGAVQTVKSLTINTAAVLTTSVTLSVTNGCVNNGSVIGTGNIALSGNTSQTLSGTGVFKKLNINTGANVAVVTGSNLKFQ